MTAKFQSQAGSVRLIGGIVRLRYRDKHWYCRFEEGDGAWSVILSECWTLLDVSDD